MEVNSSRFRETIEECEKVLSNWKDIKWEDLVHNMDQEARGLVQTRETVSQGKQKLTISTKQWVQLPESQKLDGMKGDSGLLKMYQEYISTISNHTSDVETAFLTVYKLLTKIQSPNKALSLVMREKGIPKALEDAAKSNNKHLNTIKRHEEEMSELTNQEVTIQDLRSEIQEMKAETEKEISSALLRGREEGCKESDSIFEELKKRENEIATELHRAGAERTELAARSEQIQTDMVYTQEKMDQMQSTREYTESLLKQENDALRAEAADLKAELASLQFSLEDKVSTEVLEISEKSRVLEERLKLGVDQQQHDNETIKSLKNTIKVIEKKSDTQNDTISSLSDQCSVLRDQVRDTIDTSNRLKKQEVDSISAMDRENELLKQNNATLMEQSETLQTELRNSEKLICKLEDDLSSLTTTGMKNDDEFKLGTVISDNVDNPALSVVSGQRDRYKVILFKLESDYSELKKQHQDFLTKSRDDHSQLVQENQRLFDKLKYQQPDSNTVAVSMPVAIPTRVAAHSVDNLYRFITMTSYTRIAFLLYFCFLHLVVFFLVSRVSKDTHSRSALRYPHQQHGTAAF